LVLTDRLADRLIGLSVGSDPCPPPFAQPGSDSVNNDDDEEASSDDERDMSRPDYWTSFDKGVLTEQAADYGLIDRDQPAAIAAFKRKTKIAMAGLIAHEHQRRIDSKEPEMVPPGATDTAAPAPAPESEAPPPTPSAGAADELRCAAERGGPD
jgi:hypothetical protein